MQFGPLKIMLAQQSSSAANLGQLGVKLSAVETRLDQLSLRLEGKARQAKAEDDDLDGRSNRRVRFVCCRGPLC